MFRSDFEIHKKQSMAQQNDDSRGKSRRGFAAMDKEKQRKIASMGGKASHGGRGKGSDSNR